MERLHHQQGCSRQHEPAKHTQYHRHIIFGHICRLPDNTPARKALDSMSGDTPHHDWNRPAGRPRTTRISQIVRDTRLTAADAWAIADDRSTWRALRPTAGYAQQ